jgi:hypothetical protein
MRARVRGGARMRYSYYGFYATGCAAGSLACSERRCAAAGHQAELKSNGQAAGGTRAVQA